jgi:GTP cyclohydrolase I
MAAHIAANGRGPGHGMTAAAGPAIAAASAAAAGAAANGTAGAVRTPAAEPGHFPPALRVVHDGTIVDVAAAQRAAADFLQALGMDTRTESLRDTPRRMASAYAELLHPSPFNLTTFPNDEGYDELVLARAIPVHSLCEHHMLPFIGVAHVGYLPGERILGLSKLARVVGHFARRPQVQERLTKQIADWLTEQLQPSGVGVVIQAEHTCMTLRGVQAAGSTTVTSSMLGTLRADGRSRAEFFTLAGLS